MHNLVTCSNCKSICMAVVSRNVRQTVQGVRKELILCDECYNEIMLFNCKK